jgi:hypothetical protein
MQLQEWMLQKLQQQLLLLLLPEQQLLACKVRLQGRLQQQHYSC